MGNVITFPHKNTYTDQKYDYDKVTVNINGVNLGIITASDWSYNVQDAMNDINRDKLRTQLDELYLKVKDHPDALEFVVATLTRLNQQF